MQARQKFWDKKIMLKKTCKDIKAAVWNGAHNAKRYEFLFRDQKLKWKLSK